MNGSARATGPPFLRLLMYKNDVMASRTATAPIPTPMPIIVPALSRDLLTDDGAEVDTGEPETLEIPGLAKVDELATGLLAVVVGVGADPVVVEVRLISEVVVGPC